MNSEETSSLQFVVLKGVESNPPAGLLTTQKVLLPYVHYIEAGWWLIWAGTFLFILCRSVINLRSIRLDGVDKEPR